MNYNATTPDVSGLAIRPTNQEKFRAPIGRRILEEVLIKSLGGHTFESSSAEQLSNSLSAIIRNRLKELNLPKYKYIIQVILGEERGQRVRAHAACLWDSDTDSVAHYVYSNDHLFCEASIFAVFHY
uniref:Tctex1 domain-containing protein 2 n=2 Tax=Wuchereria bancrofti TaxID=6293 RepID=A0AAF5Q3I5_WUCBA